MANASGVWLGEVDSYSNQSGVGGNVYRLSFAMEDGGNRIDEEVMNI